LFRISEANANFHDETIRRPKFFEVKNPRTPMVNKNIILINSEANANFHDETIRHPKFFEVKNPGTPMLIRILFFLTAQVINICFAAPDDC
jgi:hypothetical protein